MSGANASGLSDAELAAQTARFFGDDIHFDVSRPGVDGQAQYAITPAGDLQVVRDREALRQSLLRRMISDPDEWPTLNGYGAGLRAYVKERNTPAKRAEAESRVRAQALRDPRVASVVTSTLSPLPGGGDGLMLSLLVNPIAQLGNKPLAVDLEIS